MKYSKKAFVVLTAVILLLTACGCTSVPAKEPGPAAEKSVIIDMVGRKITVPERIDKVVALTASDCEIICALGSADLIVGRGEYCDWPEEILGVQAVQSGYETNIEQIIALGPQIVFMNEMDQTEEQIKQLEDAGITVVENDADNIEEVYLSIEIIGSVLGKTDEAKSIIETMKASFDEIKNNTLSDGEKKTVYFEVSPLEYGLWTAGSGTFMNELAGILGLENAFSDVEGWAEISEEQVIERDPDYIVTIAMYFGEGITPVEEISGRANWENISAVKNGRIFNSDSNQISRPGPRLVDAAQAMFDFIYSE